MQSDLSVHDDIMRSVFAWRGGLVFSNAGDSFGAAFDSPRDAVAAAIDIQQDLGRRGWSVDGGILVRIGIHTGEAQLRNENFYGAALNEAARIMAAGHGGQIIVSEEVASEIDHPTRPLGVHRLRDLVGRWPLHQVDVPGLPNEHMPPRSLDDHRSTLPTQRTSLIGRDSEVEMLRDLLGSHRLVTLLGAGGIGKTRVAVEVAGRSAASFPGGVFFVDLTKVSSRDSVVPAFVDGIARAVPPDRSAAEHVITELSGSESLVVVDNCEHVADSTATFLDELLAACEHVHVLTTSRVLLELADEHTVTLAPLRTDSPESPAVQLFIERALAADATAYFDAAAVDTIHTITARVDGLPLAVELAAARIRTLAPSQILTHLDDRFRLLVGTPRRDERQRSLEDTIAWSFDLLDVGEQRAFRTLAVCAGAVTLETAARLLGCDQLGAADYMESLLNKSLIHAVAGGESERGYRLHESMRAFGLRQLDEEGELDKAHLALEAALVPPHEEIAADFLAFSDAHCDWTNRTALEATTRRAAAIHAQEEGRLESAAFIYVTATSPEEPGAHQRMLERVQELRAHVEDLSPSARTALWEAQMWLETFTFRLADMLHTATDALDDLAETDPSRRIFLAYRLLAMTIVDPVSVISDTDELLPGLVEGLRRPHDYASRDDDDRAIRRSARRGAGGRGQGHSPLRGPLG